MDSISHYPFPKRRIHPNAIEIDGDTAKIVIIRTDGTRYDFLIDTDFVPIASRYRWCSVIDGGNIYASATACDKHIPLHRLVINAPPGSIVDHENHNTLDNRRRNLRIVSPKINSRNHKLRERSNIAFDRKRQMYSVVFYSKRNGRNTSDCFGCYPTLADAQQKAKQVRALLLSGIDVVGHKRLALCGYRCIYPLASKANPWQVSIRRKDQLVFHGFYPTLSDAITARDAFLAEERLSKLTSGTPIA